MRICNNYLPTSITVDIDDLNLTLSDMQMSESNSDGIVEETISDWLSDTYGYCHYGFHYEYDAQTNRVHINQIIWDTDEDDDEGSEEAYIHCTDGFCRTKTEYRQWINHLIELYQTEPNDLDINELEALKEGGYIDE